RKVIDQQLDAGTKNYIGGNCTVSLMLMGLGGLFEAGFEQTAQAHQHQADRAVTADVVFGTGIELLVDDLA
ncbi:aspartate-semialdehyde dehydrogenase, partial [Pseudomonas quasicaspiana]|nr:aspartate-semialdehyde dehydrogenase [Pseudomonas quasicaspiana]